MPKPTPRDLVKQAIRTYASLDGPTWDEAAAQVGLPAEKLRRWQRRADWPGLCREVADEDLAGALPIAVRRLVDTARTDKTSSGITAAKALVDLCLKDDSNDPNTQDAASEEFDLGKLTEKEREVACRAFAKLFGQRIGG